MGRLQALVIAGIASLATFAPAVAADLAALPPPPVPVDPAPVDFAGFYLRGDVGEGNMVLRKGIQTFYNPAQVTSPSQLNSTISAEVIFGGGVGFQFNNWFRADITGEYRTGSWHAIEAASACLAAPNNVGYCADHDAAAIHSAVFLLNGYADLGTWASATPYLGVGVGTAINTFGGLVDYNINSFGAASGYAAPKTTPRFAYALMAGFSYALTNNLKLDIGYRYLDMGRISSNVIACNNANLFGCGYETEHYHLTAHDVRIGLRYMFCEVPMPVATTTKDFALLKQY